MNFEFYVFTSRSAQFTPSGGSIFRCTTKDRGERRAKGLRSRPLDSGFLYGGMRGDVLTPYEFALVQFTRFRLVRWRAVSFSFLRLRQKQTLPLCNALRGCKHCFRRTLAYCTKCGEIVGTLRITKVLQTRQSGGCGSANLSTAAHPKGTSSGDADAPPSGRSTQRRGNKRQRRSRLNRVK